MKKLLVLALLATCFSELCFAQEKEKVAVYVSGEISPDYKKIVSSKAVARISRSKEYAAVERTQAFLNILTKEQDFQLSGDVRDDQIAALGKRFGARYVAVLDVSETDDVCFVSARMVDVESGLVVKSADASRSDKTIDSWIAITNHVAYRLVSKKSN